MDRVYYYGARVLPHATHPAHLLGGEPPSGPPATGGVDQFGGRLRPPGSDREPPHGGGGSRRLLFSDVPRRVAPLFLGVTETASSKALTLSL
jgi:hypothetical protein